MLEWLHRMKQTPGAIERFWRVVLVSALDEELALMPLTEPSPNLLAASRMRLDEMLDEMPPRSVQARFLTNFFRWMGTMQSAPALMTLLVGLGLIVAMYRRRLPIDVDDLRELQG